MGEWRGKETVAAARTGAAAGVRDAAQYLLRESRQHVPTEDNDLYESAELDVDTSAQKATVFYDTEYAVFQHEDTTFVHDDGEAKYLERPLDRNFDRILEEIAGPIRQALS